jgi:UPF0716 family protein affecting phage T7 exclusion
VKIDWSALGLVSVVSMTAALFVVAVAACGIRALDAAAERTKAGRPAGAQRMLGSACIGAAGLAVLYGIYLIVPALH